MVNRLFLRALVAFLLCPGTVAFVVPLLVLRPARDNEPANPLGVLPLALGLVVLLWCVRDFYVAGQGTLAPWSPPQRLVTVGLYRYSRNPMYVGVLLILIGWAVLFRSRALTAYAIAIGILFHLRVVLGEEPWLARTHGDDWSRYRKRVPRWFRALILALTLGTLNGCERPTPTLDLAADPVTLPDAVEAARAPDSLIQITATRAPRGVRWL